MDRVFDMVTLYPIAAGLLVLVAACASKVAYEEYVNSLKRYRALGRHHIRAFGSGKPSFLGTGTKEASHCTGVTV